MNGLHLSGRVLDGRYRLGAAVSDEDGARAHRATHLHTGATVLVRLAPSDRAPGAAPRTLEQAVQAVAGVDHPRLVVPRDVGVDPVLGPFLVTGLVEGETLREHVGAARRLPPEMALRILRGVTEALAELHGRGLTHGDLKPGRVALQPQAGGASFVRVLDPGLAGTVLASTPSAYAAPEQRAGGPPTARGDLYALGCMAYEMLAGRRPGRAPQPLDVVAPGLPPGLTEWVHALIRPRPEARPLSAAAALLALPDAAAAVAAPPPAVAAPVAPPPAVAAPVAPPPAVTPPAAPPTVPGAPGDEPLDDLAAGWRPARGRWALVAVLLVGAGVAAALAYRPAEPAPPPLAHDAAPPAVAATVDAAPPDAGARDASPPDARPPDAAPPPPKQIRRRVTRPPRRPAAAAEVPPRAHPPTPRPPPRPPAGPYEKL